MSATLVALRAIKVFFFFATFSVNVSNANKTSSKVLKEAIESIRNDCQTWTMRPLTLNSVRLPTVNVKHLIVGADVFDVYLNDLKVTGIDSYKVDAVIQSPSDSENELDVSMIIPRVALDCAYSANGSIGQTFPVNGQGSLKLEYMNITATFKLSINETFCNGRRTQSIAESGIHVKSVQYEDYMLKVNPKYYSTDIARIYEKGNSRMKGEVSQLSHILFWKLAYMTATQLSANIEICINRKLSQCNITLENEYDKPVIDEPKESTHDEEHVLQYAPIFNEHAASVGDMLWFIKMPTMMQSIAEELVVGNHSDGV